MSSKFDTPVTHGVAEEACIIHTLRFASIFLALLGLGCTMLWLAWVLYPETLTDVAVNNKVVNLTDIACAGINFLIMILAMSYGVVLHKPMCNPVAFAVSAMILAVAFITFSIFTVAGYASVTVSQVAAGMFNISVVMNEGDLFNFSLNGVVSQDNWIFSQGMGAVTMALSVCLLCLGGMACCGSRELIWMHTTHKSEQEELEKKQSQGSL